MRGSDARQRNTNRSRRDETRSTCAIEIPLRITLLELLKLLAHLLTLLLLGMVQLLPVVLLLAQCVLVEGVYLLLRWRRLLRRRLRALLRGARARRCGVPLVETLRLRRLLLLVSSLLLHLVLSQVVLLLLRPLPRLLRLLLLLLRRRLLLLLLHMLLLSHLHLLLRRHLLLLALAHLATRGASIEPRLARRARHAAQFTLAVAAEKILHAGAHDLLRRRVLLGHLAVGEGERRQGAGASFMHNTNTLYRLTLPEAQSRSYMYTIVHV